MRRMLVLSLALLALVGFLAPPQAFAQAPAAAPAPTFAIIGQVGPAKGVFGFEIDEVWGQTGFIDSNNGPGCVGGNANSAVNCGAVASGNEGSFDLNTDTQGLIQVKWLYAEFPMPLVPVPTIMRLGAQPFATAASFKLATYANGDFPGVNL